MQMKREVEEGVRRCRDNEKTFPPCIPQAEPKAPAMLVVTDKPRKTVLEKNR